MRSSKMLHDEAEEDGGELSSGCSITTDRFCGRSRVQPVSFFLKVSGISALTGVHQVFLSTGGRWSSTPSSFMPQRWLIFHGFFISSRLSSWLLPFSSRNKLQIFYSFWLRCSLSKNKRYNFKVSFHFLTWATGNFISSWNHQNWMTLADVWLRLSLRNTVSTWSPAASSDPLWTWGAAALQSWLAGWQEAASLVVNPFKS